MLILEFYYIKYIIENDAVRNRSLQNLNLCGLLWTIKYERTALDLAVKNGHYVVANVLRGHGSGMKSSGDIPETSIAQSLKRKKARVPEMAGATTVFAPIFPSRRDSEGYHSLETSTSRSGTSPFLKRIIENFFKLLILF
uniref:ANK_REP_REGION domain-containing protein n=1 Tax=Heterorhabditis bacteriophora TaxID=37862 RepID=A0A1I7X0E7_HETBA